MSRRARARSSNHDAIKARVVPMLNAWAAQKKRAMTGVTVLPGGAIHEDGWPATSSTMLPFQGGSSGNPPGVHNQHFDEVFTGNGRIMWQILSTSPGNVREIIHVHYIAPGDAGTKAAELEIPRTRYWERVHAAHQYLSGRIDEKLINRRRKVSGHLTSYKNKQKA
ncbi:MAG: hypothetical protein ACRD3Q_01595 [Terriglobales bacterium]